MGNGNQLLPHRGVCRSRRRLLRVRVEPDSSSNGKRAFYASEFGCAVNAVGVGVVVAPACKDATPELAVETVRKSACPLVNFESAPVVSLLQVVDGSRGPLFGNQKSDWISCRVLNVDSTPLFLLCYKQASTSNSASAVKRLGLTPEQFWDLQTVAMRLLGIQEPL